MTRVLVTAGAGFLGTHVAAALVSHPEVSLVVACDVRRAAHPLEGVVYDDCDLTRAAGLASLMERHRIDVVVHLAAIMCPDRDVARACRVDVEGSRNVLDACLAAGVRRIVVSSSDAAYGYLADNPERLHEDDPLRGDDAFAHDTRLVEGMLADERMRHPVLEQVVFRIGTILGPSVRDQTTALWDAPRILAIRGADSPFVFVWVDDVAGAMVRAATDGPPGVYNLSGSGRVTVREIAERVGKPLLTVPAGLLAFGLRVGRMLHLTVHGPELVDFLRYRPVLANDALRDEFGFTPRMSSREAFEAYLATHPAVSHR
jgi:nucleoside-diphosphate-sugar epimerase